MAFAFSTAGFVAQQPTIHPHGYSLPVPLVAPLLRIDASLVSAGFAVGLDADHILDGLNLNVSSMPDPSIAFCLFAMGGDVGSHESDRTWDAASIEALVRSPRSRIDAVPLFIRHLLGNNEFNNVGFSVPILVSLSSQLFPFPSGTGAP